MRSKIFSGIAHLSLWLFFLGFPLIFFLEDDKFDLWDILTFPYYLLFVFSYLSLFYLNYFFLLPRLYLKKQYRKYFLAIFLLFTVFYFLKPFILLFSNYLKEQHVKLPDFPMHKPDSLALVIFVIVVSVGLAIQVVKQGQATERRALQAEAEKANAELSYLKAQINPHFLFNTLNNIYSLALDQHQDTAASILKLSNIMRYITDDATHNFVPLEQELNCVRDFIDLQRLRHGPNVQVDFSVSGNTEAKEIAPLILMTYIENVFKYGISSREQVKINIKVNAEADRISFFCQNPVFPSPGVRESTGIGQANTKQRLEHLYPKRHELSINRGNEVYTVELTLMA